MEAIAFVASVKYQAWLLLRGQAHQTQTLVFLIIRVWARVPFLKRVYLSKTVDHFLFVLRMGQKTTCPVCYVNV